MSTMSINMMLRSIYPCPIYGKIPLDGLATGIVATREFQRLANIHQLGLCHVTLGCNHNRFQHSLGVYHLADLVLQRIAIRANISARQASLIKIAALLHDVGHGPWSHFFDMVLTKNYPNNCFAHHETRSCLIVDRIAELYPDLGISRADAVYIKSVIDPDINHVGISHQIVNNKINGIDVDKMDYLVRDSYHLGFGIRFCLQQLIDNITIDNARIVFDISQLQNVYAIYHDRYLLHQKFYNTVQIKMLEYAMFDVMTRWRQLEVIASGDIQAFLQIRETDFMGDHMLTRTVDRDFDAEARRIYAEYIFRKQGYHLIQASDSETDLQNLLSRILNADNATLFRHHFLIHKHEYGFKPKQQKQYFQEILFVSHHKIKSALDIEASPFLNIEKLWYEKWYLLCRDAQAADTALALMVKNP